MMHNFRRTFLRHFLCKPADEGADLGAPPDVTTQPVDTGAVVADTSGPTSMLQAMSAAIDQPALDASGQPRDEMGRFAAKAQEQAAADAAAATAAAGATPGATAPAAPVVAPVVPPAPEDLTVMPEGLAPKAQERFQKLANSNKELAEWRERVEPQFTAVQEAFQSNGIQREQFDTFLEFAGALNRGDVATAQRIMQTEMQHLALMTGQPLTADPLSTHPDLREAVDSFQMTEGHALEMARRRTMESHQQQVTQKQEQAQQSRQQAQQEVTHAEQAIEQFCAQMQTSDLDYQPIMKQLETEIRGGLLNDLPPKLWPQMVQRQYQLIKKVASSQRTVQPATAVLRPTGVASPGQAPKSMMDAMFPGR